MKKPLIVANWKMNPATLQEAEHLFHAIGKGVKNINNVEIVVCPPFLYIPKMQGTRYKIRIGGQDCFWEDSPTGGGAFTGEISGRMLKNLGCSYVILGHSERKKYAAETLPMTKQKVKAALLAQLIPIICVGEDIDVEMPIVLHDISHADMAHVVLTFEPEWAISTEVHAKPVIPLQVREVIGKMRMLLAKLFDERTALETAILYGGSVNSGTIGEYIKHGFAQGALVGASSLDAKEFVELVKNAAT